MSPIRREDFEQPPCACAECFQARVTHLGQRRDPRTGKWLHGYALQRWYEAQGRFLADVARLTDKKGMR